MSLEPYIDQRDIENKALRVLEDYKIDKPVVDVAKIAKALGKVPKITQATPVYKFIKIGLYLPENILKSSL